VDRPPIRYATPRHQHQRWAARQRRLASRRLGASPKA